MVVSCNPNFEASLPAPFCCVAIRPAPPPASAFLPPLLASCSFVFFPFFLFACVASWLDIDLAIVVHCHCLYVCKMEYVEIEKKMGQKLFWR